MFSSFYLDSFRTWLHPLIASLGISNQLSLSLYPDPTQAHTRRRGLVSPVQISGLAPALAALSNQWNRRVAFSGSKNKYFNHTDDSQWPICNPTLAITRLQYFRNPRIQACDTRPHLLTWAGRSLGTRLQSWLWAACSARTILVLQVEGCFYAK